MSAISPLKRLVPLGLGAVALASFVSGTSPTGVQDPNLDSIEPIAQREPAQAVCDIDGVDVSYHTAYRSSPTLGYDLIDVLIEDVSSTCGPARLSVELELVDGLTASTASGEILKLSDTENLPDGASVVPGAGGLTVTLPIVVESTGGLADVADAMSVAIEMEGGDTPVPTACLHLRIAAIQVGTIDNEAEEHLTGTNPGSDLIYGLSGKDKITSLQGDDCLHTAPDDVVGDVITAGNGSNVISSGAGDDKISVGHGMRNLVLSGGGNDTVVVGNGANNTINAGDGDDIITVGSGKNNRIDGGDGIDTCVGPKGKIVAPGCENPS